MLSHFGWTDCAGGMEGDVKMGDTRMVYEPFGIGTFKDAICAELGEDFWNGLVEDLTLPDIDTECHCRCCNMVAFMKRLQASMDTETLHRILYRVRHGVSPAQSAWAHQEFLQLGDLDAFIQKHLASEWDHFVELNRERKDFYGQMITDEVLAFIKDHPHMLAPVRKGNKLKCMAFPGNMEAYLNAPDDRMKRYHACHCPFARESILADETVSSALCNCSLGHVANFSEAFLGVPLSGRVVSSVLAGDLTCEYEIDLPDEVMRKYVKEEYGDCAL